MGKPNKTAKAKAEQQAIEESTLSFGDAAALLERCLVECGIELFSDRLKVAVPPHLQLEFKKGIVLFFFTDFDFCSHSNSCILSAFNALLANVDQLDVDALRSLVFCLRLKPPVSGEAAQILKLPAIAASNYKRNSKLKVVDILFVCLFVVVVRKHVEVVDELAVIVRQSFEAEDKVETHSCTTLYG
jgi:hypothetical protein